MPLSVAADYACLWAHRRGQQSLASGDEYNALQQVGLIAIEDEPALPALMDPAVLQAALAERAPALQSMMLHAICGSTNDLAAAANPTPAAVCSLLQSAGRGRRGRRWHGQPGGSLLCSLRLELPASCPYLSAVSVAAGAAICAVLRRQLGVSAGLKWPNDVWLAGGKLAGVLVEASNQGDRTNLIVGFGLNLSVPESDEGLRWPVADLYSHCEVPPSPEYLLASLLGALLDKLPEAARRGLGPQLDQLADVDLLAGRRFAIEHGGATLGPLRGEGLDAAGRLCTRNQDGLQQSWSAGEISLTRFDD